MLNVLDLASKKVNLKKVASTHGGEWTGPCPACGGNDRFHVWPNTNGDKGSYWCRGCGKSGDNIQFLIDFEGMNFKEACEYLNIHISDDRPINRPPAEKTEFQPVTHQNPAELWQEKAEKFVSWAQQCLTENADVMKWLSARGISASAALAARLGWNPGENGNDIFRPRTAWGLPELKKENGKPRMLWIPQGLVIPYIIDGMIQRIRIRRPEGEPRYYVVLGSSMATMILGIERHAYVIVESELDAISCAAATDLAGAVALGTLQGKPDASAYAILKDAVQILNALDYGDTGGGKKAAERAMTWWSENFNDRCDRWPVPKGKDPGEAVQQGIDLKSWIEAGLVPALTLEQGSRFSEPVDSVGNPKANHPRSAATRDKVQSSKLKETKECPPPAGVAQSAGGGVNPPSDYPELLKELYKLLRDNPAVKIINTPERFTVLRNDRYVGGRINELVMKPGEVNDYLLSHPDEEITWKNLFKGTSPAP
ncbi:MAG: CHC2 zinc finger domain-containing protein [Smithellaceae bacterium]|jgi:hypothetical protein